MFNRLATRYNLVMHYDFDHPPERSESECFKWQTYDRNVLPMWVADMDFPSPQPVIDALLERVRHGVFGYPRGVTGQPEELPELRQVIVERLARLYRWDVAPEAVVFMPGTHVAFDLASHAFAAPDGLLVQPPVYQPIYQSARTTGALHQEAPLIQCPDGRYEIDLDAFRAAITPDTRMFLLCNPHNPTGRVFRREELEGLAEACLQHDVLICSDEVHCDLLYSGQHHTPIATLAPEIARRTITLMAPSKTFNLAGLQFAFAVIEDAELRRRYLRARRGLVGWNNLMGLVAARAAYEAGQEWLDQALGYIESNRAYLGDYLANELPEIGYYPPEGTYLAWLDCRSLELPEGPYKFFLKQARLALNDGRSFGTGGDGFVRLNFGCCRQVLTNGLERIKHALLARQATA